MFFVLFIHPGLGAGFEEGALSIGVRTNIHMIHTKSPILLVFNPNCGRCPKKGKEIYERNYGKEVNVNGKKMVYGKFYQYLYRTLVFKLKQKGKETSV